MSREILFRGKVTGIPLYLQDKTKISTWVYGSYVSYPVAQIFDLEDEYVVDPSTVGQFTGLCDKNGVKIFEGDVIRIKIKGESPFTFNYLRKVVFVNGIFGIGKQKDEESIRPFPIYSMDMFKIIGNIHDNPELLEVGQE